MKERELMDLIDKVRRRLLEAIGAAECRRVSPGTTVIYQLLIVPHTNLLIKWDERDIDTIIIKDGRPTVEKTLFQGKMETFSPTELIGLIIEYGRNTKGPEDSQGDNLNTSGP